MIYTTSGLNSVRPGDGDGIAVGDVSVRLQAALAIMVRKNSRYTSYIFSYNSGLAL
jgi:hypothetical protein